MCEIGAMEEHTIENTLALDCLLKAGYAADSIERIPEGNSHYNFNVRLDSGDEVIAKFDKPHRFSPDGRKRDYHYNGELSLEREASLCSLVRKKVGLPAPEIKGIHQVQVHDQEHKFLVVEKMPGQLWDRFIHQNDYSLEKYLKSLEYLGADIAQVQQFQFRSYGDVMGEDNVEPQGILDFAERLSQITDLKLQRARQAQSLGEREMGEVSAYFAGHIRQLDGELKKQSKHKSKNQEDSPVLVLTDLHPRNFLVDEKGKPSGYIDLEFCQSGHPSLEFYLAGLQFFNYFNQNTFEAARKSFFQGFTAQGGSYALDDPLNQQLEKVLCAQHMLAAVTAYHRVKDGLRDTWSQRFKELLFHAINDNEVDYIGFADIIREKMKQPKNPARP